MLNIMAKQKNSQQRHTREGGYPEPFRFCYAVWRCYKNVSMYNGRY
jgi:hypothetical protein